MRNKASFSLFLLLLLLFITEGAFAQRAGLYIGKVNMYELLLLHPAMIWYSKENRAFKVTRTSIDKQRVERKKAVNSEEQQKIEYSMKAIKARIKEEKNRYNNNLAMLNKKYFDVEEVSTATLELNKENYKRKTSEAQATHQVKLTSLYGEYSVLETKLEELYAESFDKDYTTREETDKRFESIINEIKAYTKRIADQKGISIVLNSSHKRLINSNNRKPENFLNHNPLGYIFNPQVTKETVRDEGALIGYYKGIESATLDWLDSGGDIFYNAGKILANEDIVVGGIDLTTEVLGALYKAYKLDPNVSNAVIQSIKR